jgi:hypothetical protein
MAAAIKLNVLPVGAAASLVAPGPLPRTFNIRDTNACLDLQSRRLPVQI